MEGKTPKNKENQLKDVLSAFLQVQPVDKAKKKAAENKSGSQKPKKKPNL